MDFSASAEDVLGRALDRAGLAETGPEKLVSTGYGRSNVARADQAKTEITCQAKGCYHHFQQAQTIIDIGGQDNKVIKLDDRGRRLDFQMNRKCAAGTGAFLEEMSARLGLELGAMNDLAGQTDVEVALGAYCTVFSATEVLEKIRAGQPVAGIVRGIYASMVRRVLDMDPLDGFIVLTGGVVAHNPVLARIMEQLIGRPVHTPPRPQITGALGAALLARDM